MQFLPCDCTVLLLRSKPVEPNCLHFQKSFETQRVLTLRTLRVSNTKRTSRKAFIAYHFALGSKKIKI